MAVAFDAVTPGGEFSGASPHTVNHTPAGTPRGVFAFITQGGTSAGNDTTTGVTYGGATMPRPTNGWASDTSGEAGSAFCYFLGSSVPAGAQDCVVSTNGGSALKWIYVVTLTAASDLEIVATGKIDGGDPVDPQIALDSGAVTAMRFAAIYSGLSTVAGLAPLADHTAVASHDFGAYVSRVDRQTNPGSGSFTMGYTAAADDVAMVAVAVSEITAGDAPPSKSFVGLQAVKRASFW